MILARPLIQTQLIMLLIGNLYGVLLFLFLFVFQETQTNNYQCRKENAFCYVNK